MIPRGGTVLPSRFVYSPLYKKKPLTGKEDHSNDILTFIIKDRQMYLAFATPINAYTKTLLFVNNQLFHRENKVTFLHCFQSRKPIVIWRRPRRFSVMRTEGLFA